jgi:hypothetical protein
VSSGKGMAKPTGFVFPHTIPWKRSKDKKRVQIEWKYIFLPINFSPFVSLKGSITRKGYRKILMNAKVKRNDFLSKCARIPPSFAGGMNGLPSPLGGERVRVRGK